MAVDSTNIEYDRRLKDWQLVRDCVDGQSAVKYRRERYLPKPNPEDKSEQNETRYNQYLTRAEFTNFTGRTKRGLIGAIFRKPPQVELPSQLQYLINDATRSGMSLANLSKLATGDVMDTGRSGILVDYPQTPDRLLTLEESRQYRATLEVYKAEQVINWHVGKDGVLDLVVLREIEEITTDGFEFDYEFRYRALRLIEGVYVQEYYREGGGAPLWIEEPRKADGSRFTEIPWAWIGAEDNDEKTDVAPLFDIAVVNIAHFRNSADYEESSFMVGQPTPVISGLTQAWVDENPGPYLIGSRNAWLLPEGGSADLMQADPNQMPQQAMKDKEERMVMIGAKIIQDQAANETAEAARMRASGDNSVLTTIAENVSAAFTKAIMWAAEFMGANESQILFELNTEFFDKAMDAQMIMAQMQLVDRGDIGRSDFRENLRKGGVIDNERTDEDIDSEAGDYIVPDNVPEDDQGG